MKKLVSAIFLVSLVTSSLAIGQPAAGFGELYYEGMVVGPVVPPASSPNESRDNLFVVPNQRAVIGIAPGDKGYHGGHWAIHSVVWKTDPYLLISKEEVMVAAIAEDITVTRIPSIDFKCPVQFLPRR